MSPAFSEADRIIILMQAYPAGFFCGLLPSLSPGAFFLSILYIQICTKYYFEFQQSER